MHGKISMLFVIAILFSLVSCSAPLSYIDNGSIAYDEYVFFESDDFVGGSTIVFEADIENPPQEQVQMVMDFLSGRLRHRGYFYNIRISQIGTRQIRIELPHYANVEAVEEEFTRQIPELNFKDEDGNVLLTGEHIANAHSTIEAVLRENGISFQPHERDYVLVTHRLCSHNIYHHPVYEFTHDENGAWLRIADEIRTIGRG
jgi:hypothetical protein